jgi:hypothetical protein
MIGSTAQSTLAQNTRASVLGVTSRGIFLLAPSRQIIFLSYESYCGPLSVNLDRTAGQTLSAANGQNVIFQDAFLSFPDGGDLVSLVGAPTWQPPQAANRMASIPESLALLKRITTSLHPDKSVAGLAPILNQLMGEPNLSPLPDDLQPAYASILELTHLYEVSLEDGLQAISRLLGLGRGLTPSGDDFITGLLLILNRLPAGERFGKLGRPFNSLLIEMAYQKTTTLSANIIECAADGSADERLILPADGLIRADADPQACAALLESYGHSSGIDALTGMAAAFYAFAHQESSHEKL